ncbi:acyl-CoA synthetase family member 2 [Nomia melanderi]|uniref:acyl-CoA synthetase family member 2 n=1 Tax=Nomia melanderi TaxID=2448451 RepID=UPI003FCD780B
MLSFEVLYPAFGTTGRRVNSSAKEMLRTFASRALPAGTSYHFHGRALASGQSRDRAGASELRHVSMRQRRFNHGPGKNLSYISNGGSVPLIDVTVGQLMDTASERWPDKECLISVDQNVRLTFSQLLRRADRFAAGLKKLGLRKGDRVGIWSPNTAEWLTTFWACLRAGFICVPLNSAYQLGEMTYCLEKVGIKAVISPDRFKTQDYPSMLLQAKQSCPNFEHIIIASRDHVAGTRRYCDVEELAARIEVEAIAAEQDAVSCSDECAILFTSGTTGRPKAALLTHRSVVNNSRQVLERSEIRAEHKACLNVPFFHVFAIIKSLVMLQSGSSIVLESPSFNPVKSIEAMLKEKCEITYGTPTMWINLLDAHQRLQPPPIRLFSGVTGGAPAAPELFRRVRECFHFDKMKTIYGQTEGTAVVCQSLPGEPAELTDKTVGHVSCHMEIKVVDQKGATVPLGTVGELCVRGYNVMKGYWGDEENTAKTITEDGWLKTGDQFILRPDGYGHIIGRLKDMLIRGGENIFPKEVEDFLMTHPMVLEAHVIGAYDRVYGEEICACVRLREGARLTAEELKSHCKGKIAHFKIPRYVEFLDEFPKTGSGKVQKFRLKQEMERKGVIPAAPSEPEFSTSVSSV